MTMERTCGEAIVSLLEAYGIDTAFGIPGVHTLDFYRGLENSTMRVVTARHEQGAGFMADGYARVSGRPAACLVITGPGVTNIATAVGQAYSDSVPMLVIASVNETEHLGMGRGRLHEITNQRDTIAPLTGFSATAFSPDDVPPLLTRAYAVFDSQRPRPVYIEVPLDVMAAPASFAPHNRPAMPRPTPSAEAVAEAVDLIRGARRPAIIAGGGAQDDGPRLLALAELLGAAVVLTTAGKGAVSEDHPLCVGSSLAEPETRALLAGSDLVIAIGTELAETDTWHERLEFGGKLIRIDIDSHMLYGDYLPDAALLGDAGSALGLLLAALNSNGVQRADPTGESGFQAAREDWRSALSPKRRKHAAVLDALRDALPEDGFIFLGCHPDRLHRQRLLQVSPAAQLVSPGRLLHLGPGHAGGDRWKVGGALATRRGAGR